jgi:arginine-tRNA-protein transferase
VPVRIVLDQFSPTRSQKRAYKQHSNLTATLLPLDYYERHFALYRQYQFNRHPSEPEKSKTTRDEEKEQYQQFLCQSNVESLMVEFKDSQGQIKIVSVVDIIDNGVSAVYTFYDTKQKASFGTYAIMWLASWTKDLNLPYLYLGYWIAESQKMAYKENFQVQEKLIDGEWINIGPAR